MSVKKFISLIAMAAIISAFAVAQDKAPAQSSPTIKTRPDYENLTDVGKRNL